MTPRPHAEIIKLWAEGHNVQYRRPGSNEWVDSPDPAFVSDYSYRVKPARNYPTTAVHAHRLLRVVEGAAGKSFAHCLYELANFVLREAVDNGQVVTREEFAKVSEEAQCATKSLIAAGYTYRGGELWKPPLGKPVNPVETDRRLINCLRDVRDTVKAIFPTSRISTPDGEFLFVDYITRTLKAAGADVN